jgi:hypothetical protein
MYEMDFKKASDHSYFSGSQMFFKAEAKGFSRGRPGPHLCPGRDRPSCISHWTLPHCHGLSLPFLVFLLKTSQPSSALCVTPEAGKEESSCSRKKKKTGSIFVTV